MQPDRFDHFRERLLRAGISSRHIHRYLHELRDHYEDILQDELTKTSDRNAAEEAASMRLGTDEDLMRSALLRPELRSTVARRPGLVLGLGPALLWMGSFFLTLFLLILFSEILTLPAGRDSKWIFVLTYGICVFYTRALPVIFVVMALTISLRHHLPWHWPLAGAATLALLAGTTEANLTLATTPGSESQLGLSSSLLPFLLPFLKPLGAMNPLALAEGLVRTALILATALGMCFFWHRRQRMAESG